MSKPQIKINNGNNTGCLYYESPERSIIQVERDNIVYQSGDRRLQLCSDTHRDRTCYLLMLNFLADQKAVDAIRTIIPASRITVNTRLQAMCGALNGHPASVGLQSLSGDGLSINVLFPSHLYDLAVLQASMPAVLGIINAAYNESMIRMNNRISNELTNCANGLNLSRILVESYSGMFSKFSELFNGDLAAIGLDPNLYTWNQPVAGEITTTEGYTPNFNYQS